MNITPDRLARATAILVALQEATPAATSINSGSDSNVNTGNNHNNDRDGAYDRCLVRNHKRKRCRDTFPLSSGTPSTITKRMELNEWAIPLLFIDHVQPSKQLSALIHEFFVVDHDDENNNTTTVNSWHNDVISIINEILLRLLKQSSCHLQSESGLITLQSPSSQPLSATTTFGYVDVVGPITANKQFIKAIVALYYHSLEAILFCEKVRTQTHLQPETSKAVCEHFVMSTIPKTVTHAFLCHNSFHRALIACCYVSISQAIHYTRKIRPSKAVYDIPIYSLLQNIVQCSYYEFIKVLKTFFIPSLSVHSKANRQLGSPFIFTLPRCIIYDMKIMEMNIIDSLLWVCNSPLRFVDTWANQIRQIQGVKSTSGNTNDFCSWPPKCLAPVLPEEVENVTDVDVGSEEPDVIGTITKQSDDTFTLASKHPNYFDFHLVEYIIGTMLSTARKRIFKLCKVLLIIQSSTSDDPMMMIVSQQIFVVFRCMVRNYVHLFYDRHIDHWILCTIYGVTRSIKYQPELKFAQIISAYIYVREYELGTATCQQIVRHVKLVNTDPSNTTATPSINTQQGMGNVISLYNKVFVPTMKEYLLHSHSLRMCSIRLSSQSCGETTSNTL